MHVKLPCRSRARGNREQVTNMLPSPLSYPLLSQQSGDLPLFRKTLHLLLGEYELSVSGDLKHPTGGRNQLHLRAKRLFQFLFQPGSTRLIVSLCTIFDCDLHGFSIKQKQLLQFLLINSQFTSVITNPSPTKNIFKRTHS